MKKVLCVIAAIAMVAAVSTSCNKKCTCTVKGSTASTTFSIDELNKNYNANIKKCSELNLADVITCK